MITRNSFWNTYQQFKKKDEIVASETYIFETIKLKNGNLYKVYLVFERVDKK